MKELRRKMRYCFKGLLVGLIFLTVGCTERSYNSSNTNEDITQIYSDLLTSSINQPASDSLQTLTAVLQKHRITKEEFDKRISGYESNPGAWFQIVNSALQQLERADSTADPGRYRSLPPKK